MIYHVPNVAKSIERLEYVKAQAKIQLDLAILVAPALASYKRKSFDGWLERHLKANLPSGVWVRCTNDYCPQLKVQNQDLNYNYTLSIYPDGSIEKLAENLQLRIEGIKKEIQDIDNLIPKIPELSAKWAELATAIDAICNLPSMYAIRDEFYSVKH